MISTGFNLLDGLTAGVDPGKTYLIYGNDRSGKTTFAMGFTAEGLNRGERCVYVSGRPAKSILSQASAFGFDFASQLSQNLVLLEYPENVQEHSTRLLDDSRIFGEFQTIIGAEHFDRIVFDPVTPLVAGLTPSAASTRLRSMARLFTANGATAFYLSGPAGPDNHLAACKEVAHGILRLEREGQEGSANTMTVERLSGFAAGSTPILRFDVVPGIGLRGTADSESPVDGYSAAPKTAAPRSYSFAAPSPGTPATNNGTPRQSAPILLIHPDAGERLRLRSLLERLRPVVDASGAADGISLLSTAAPAVAVVALTGRGASGIEIVRKIRNSGRTLPILMLAAQCRRRTDVIEPLQAGVDVCLPDPPDSRALALHINNLLSRSTGRAMPPAVLDYTPPPRQMGCTKDLDYFMERLEAEAQYAEDYGGRPVVVTLREPFNCSYSEELANLTSVLVRSSDLVYSGQRGVAILLADASDATPFLARFSSRWNEAVPGIEELQPDAGADYLMAAREFLLTNVAIARATSPAPIRVLATNGTSSAGAARVGEF